MRLSFFISILIFISSILYGDTVTSIKNRGYLLCGVSGDVRGFSLDVKGVWSGLDVDYCKALAVAIFNNPESVRFVKTSSEKQFEDLKNFKFDILARSATWDIKYDTSLGVKFIGVSYYDGQGFLILKDFQLDSALELNNANICIAAHSDEAKSVNYYFKKHNMKYNPILKPEKKAIEYFEKGRCDTLTGNKSKLYAIKSTLKNPSLYKILPETISKKPLGPVVREGDDNWLDITKWVLNLLLEAEELNINKKNVFLFLETSNTKIQKLLAINNSINIIQGLNEGWAYNVILKIGNYKDIFEKNLTNDKNLNIKRELNALWNKGGIMCPLPIN